MATVTGPLQSLMAIGPYAKTIIFQRNRGRCVAKRYARPTIPNTPEQLAVQAFTRQQMQLWPTLTQEQRDTWLPLASVDAIEPINAFLRVNWSRHLCGRDPTPVWPPIDTPPDYSFTVDYLIFSQEPSPGYVSTQVTPTDPGAMAKIFAYASDSLRNLTEPSNLFDLFAGGLWSGEATFDLFSFDTITFQPMDGDDVPVGTPSEFASTDPYTYSLLSFSAIRTETGADITFQINPLGHLANIHVEILNELLEIVAYDNYFPIDADETILSLIFETEDALTATITATRRDLITVISDSIPIP